MPVTVNGVTSNTLTSVIDTVTVTGTDKDIVTGQMSTDTTLDTLNDGDIVDGNGLTTLRVTLGDKSKSPAFFLNDVNKVDFIGAADGQTILYAPGWKDVHIVKFTGTDNGQSLSISELKMTGEVKIRLGGQYTNKLDVAGELNGLTYSYDATNNHVATDGKGVGLRVTAHNDIYMNGGIGDTATLAFGDDLAVSTADISNGDAIIGDVHLKVANADTADNGAGAIYLTHAVDVKQGAGNASVGNFTIGDVNGRFGTGDNYGIFAVEHKADAGTAGDASVGDLTVGDISMVMGTGFSYASILIDHSATGAGDAKVGNTTVGDISYVGKGGHEYALYAVISASASASGAAGDASIGNMSVGMMDFVVGNDSTNGTLTVKNYAAGYNGNATAGDFSIGGLSIIAGNFTSARYPSITIALTNAAQAAWSANAAAGDAKVGDMVIGDVTVTGGTSFSIENFTIKNTALASGSAGTATVGDTTIGNIELAAGYSGYIDWDVDVSAKAIDQKTIEGLTEVGLVTIGNIKIDAGYNVTVNYSNYVTAAWGKTAGYVVGDIDVQIDDEATLNMSHYVYGGGIGQVKMGDISIVAGDNATLDFTLYASALGTKPETRNLRSYIVGDIDVAVNKSAGFDDLTFYAYAKNNIGKVDFGDIRLNATGDGTVNLTGTFNVDGKIGSFAIGDIDLSATGDGASATVDLNFTADLGVAAKKGLTFGDMKMFANVDATASVDIHITTSKGDVGNVTVGDVSIKILDKATGGFNLTVTGDNGAGQTAGDVTIGDVNLVAKGSSITLEFTVKVTSFDDVGSINIGDVRIVGFCNGKAKENISFDFTATLDGDGTGDINIGDMVFKQLKPTTDLNGTNANDWAIKVTAKDGTHDINIGDIKVIGGYVNAAGAELDNLGGLSGFMTLAATGKITLGNIDYSKYLNAATIGESAHAWHGMANIKAAQGDTMIYDTEERNVITLNRGADIIYLGANQVTDENDPTQLDTIINFQHARDTIYVEYSNGNFERAGPMASYEDFLSTAKTHMSTGGVDVYVASVGSDSFVAVDANNDGALDWVAKVQGVTNLSFGDFVV